MFACLLLCLLGRKFSNKCKHSVKCIRYRMDTIGIRKKKQSTVRHLKKDVADLISGGHETIAFGRMDALIVEINQSSCYDMIEQYCCCILEHLPTMKKDRVCPEETVEAVATLIFAAARFADLPELADLRSEFKNRYGTHMEAYVNEEFVEKMQKKPFPQDKKLRLMQEIAQEFSIHWDFKAFEYKILNPSAPTLDQPKIQFPSSNENNNYKQPHILDERREVIDGRSVINGTKTVLNKAEYLDTVYQVSDVQKQQIKSEELISTENIKEYEHHPHDSTEKFKKVVADELENTKSHQSDEKDILNAKTKDKQNGNHTEDWICGQVHEELGLIGIERQTAASMVSRDAKAVNMISPCAKVSRDFNGTSANQDNFPHAAASEVVKEMDHNVQGSQSNRTANPKSKRAFNPKPPYVKPKVTKSTSLETGYAKPTSNEMSNGGDGGNYLMNAPFTLCRTAINADSNVEDANLLGQISIKQAGAVGKKNSMHGDVNDQQSFISPLSKQTEDDATYGAIYCGRHMQRAFSDQPRQGSRLS